MAGHGAAEAVVDAPGVKISLKLGVNGLRAVQIKPGLEFLQCARRERSDGAFDVLNSVQAHVASPLLQGIVRWNAVKIPAFANGRHMRAGVLVATYRMPTLAPKRRARTLRLRSGQAVGTEFWYLGHQPS